MVDESVAMMVRRRYGYNDDNEEDGSSIDLLPCPADSTTDDVVSCCDQSISSSHAVVAPASAFGCPYEVSDDDLDDGENKVAPLPMPIFVERTSTVSYYGENDLMDVLEDSYCNDSIAEMSMSFSTLTPALASAFLDVEPPKPMPTTRVNSNSTDSTSSITTTASSTIFDAGEINGISPPTRRTTTSPGMPDNRQKMLDVRCKAIFATSGRRLSSTSKKIMSTNQKLTSKKITNDNATTNTAATTATTNNNNKSNIANNSGQMIVRDASATSIQSTCTRRNNHHNTRTSTQQPISQNQKSLSSSSSLDNNNHRRSTMSRRQRRQHEEQRQQQPKKHNAVVMVPPPRTPTKKQWKRIMVDIVPGYSIPLRGSEETWDAFCHDRIVTYLCQGCGTNGICIQTCTVFICPQCRSISENRNRSSNATESLGLGMTEEDVFRIVSSSTTTTTNN